MNNIDKLEEMKDIVRDMQEKIGELAMAYESLEQLGYSNYRIRQELETGYMGGLRELIDEKLPEELEELANEGEGL